MPTYDECRKFFDSLGMKVNTYDDQLAESQYSTSNDLVRPLVVCVSNGYTDSYILIECHKDTDEVINVGIEN